MKPENEVRELDGMLAALKNSHTKAVEFRAEIDLLRGVVGWILEDIDDQTFQSRLRIDLINAVEVD